MEHSDRDHSSRGTFIRGAAAAGIGALIQTAATQLSADAFVSFTDLATKSAKRV